MRKVCFVAIVLKRIFRKPGCDACNLTLKNNAIPTIVTLPLFDKTPAGNPNA
ncbi:hypothetical protein WN55_02851 [Dufourea novaeangliae]|uniref:Uncharacterized protein n=1 Tax=Dufourea novaeangliae TaxID=178035 RepID=A0A154PIA0_DUFNO|nr:hypothetical protein WN55_02851 [Dufourea novaeangliae]